MEWICSRCLVVNQRTRSIEPIRVSCVLSFGSSSFLIHAQTPESLCTNMRYRLYRSIRSEWQGRGWYYEGGSAEIPLEHRWSTSTCREYYELIPRYLYMQRERRRELCTKRKRESEKQRAYLHRGRMVESRDTTKWTSGDGREHIHDPTTTSTPPIDYDLGY